MASHHRCCGVRRLHRHGDGCGGWRCGGIGMGVFVEAMTMLRDIFPVCIGAASGILAGALLLWACGF